MRAGRVTLILCCVALIQSCERPLVPAKRDAAPDTSRDQPRVHVGRLTALDEEVCELGAGHAPKEPKRIMLGTGEFSRLARYLVQEYVADLTGDGRADHLTVYDTGSAHFLEAMVVDADGNVHELDEPPAADVGEGDRLDDSERIMPYAGQVYIIGFRGRDPDYIDRVSRLEPGLKLRPVCRYRLKHRGSLDAEGGDTYDAAKPICEAIAKNSVKPIREVRYREPRPINDPTGRRIPEMNLVGEARVDFLNDGRPQRLSRIELSSGLGPGCFSVSYELAAKSTPNAAGQLQQLQDREPEYLRGHEWPTGTCSDNLRWLKVKGRTYLQIKGFDGHAPENEEKAYNSVVTIENGVKQRVCTGSYYVVPEVSAKWDGARWVPTP